MPKIYLCTCCNHNILDAKFLGFSIASKTSERLNVLCHKVDTSIRLVYSTHPALGSAAEPPEKIILKKISMQVQHVSQSAIIKIFAFCTTCIHFARIKYTSILTIIQFSTCTSK